MKEKVFIYNELKEDIFDDINAEMREGGSSFLEAASVIIHNSIELAQEKNEANEIMIFLIIALKACELKEFSEEVRRDMKKIIDEGKFAIHKHQFSIDSYKIIEKDLEFIKNEMYK
jgi:hypothetical protein